MQSSRSMVECFSEIEDPRADHTRHHLLVDIVCLAVLAVIAGAEGWEDIEAFGKDKHTWLKRYLRLPNGIPSHDPIARVFRQLKPQAFQEAFMTWIDGTASVTHRMSQRRGRRKKLSRNRKKTNPNNRPRIDRLSERTCHDQGIGGGREEAATERSE